MTLSLRRLAVLESAAILVLVTVLLTRDPVPRPVTEGASVRTEQGGETASPDARKPRASEPSEANSPQVGLDPGAPARVLLHGTIRISSGVLTPRSTHLSAIPAGGDEHLSGTVSASGAYAIPGLRQGPIDLVCRGKGFAEHRWHHELGPEPVQRLDLVVSGSRKIEVYLVDAQGKPYATDNHVATPQAMSLRRVVVMATPPGQAPQLLPGSTNNRPPPGAGRFRSRNFPGMEPLPEGCHGVLEVDGVEPRSLHACNRSVVIGSAPLAPTATAVHIPVTLDVLEGALCTLRARFLLPSGAPVEQGGHILIASTGTRSGPIAAEGRIELRRLDPGDYTLFTSVQGYESLGLSLHLAPGQVLDLGDIRLQAAIRISGRVLDAGGHPLSASVHFERSGSSRRGGPRAGSLNLRADDTGHFELSNAGVGLYTFFAQTEAGLGWCDVDTRSGPVDDLVIRIAACRVLRLTSELGPFDLRLVEIHTLQGLSLWSAEAIVGWTGSARLPEGDYVVRTHRPGAVPTIQNVTLGPDGASATIR